MPDPIPPSATAVLELSVRNHPGTLSHVTGLFARRAFNLEAVFCVPEGDRSTSRMLLLVAHGERLDQIVRQLARLHDVLGVVERADLGPAFFEGLAAAGLPERLQPAAPP